MAAPFIPNDACGASKPNMAEVMIDIANAFKRMPGLVLSFRNTPETIGRLKLSLDLRSRPALALRAMFENWTLEKIIRELR
jgi:hypothetical protein